MCDFAKSGLGFRAELLSQRRIVVVVLDTGFFPEKEADFRATVLCG
jgi:hypothetical protein